MKKHFTSYVAFAVALIVVLFGGANAQNIVNNGKITNKATKTITAASIDNNSRIYNSGTVTVSGNLDNNAAAAEYRNFGTQAGITSVGGNLDNTAGIFDNDTVGVGTFVGELLLAGVLTPGTRFDTDSGRVVFNGGAQTVPALTYGALAAQGNGAKSLGGNVTVNDTMRIEVYFNVSASTLTVNALTGIISDTDTATFNGGTGTVIYAADADQAIYPSVLYNNLTLSNGTETNKQVAGNLTVLGGLTIGAQDSLDVTGTFSLNGGSTALTNNGGIKLAGNATVAPTTLNTTGTFVYYANVGSQNVAAFSYADLILRNSGTKTFTAGTYSVTGDFRFESDLGAMTAAETDFQAGSTFRYVGTLAQSVAADTYVTLEFANDGQKTMNGAVVASAVNVASSVTGGTNDGVYVGTSGSLTVNSGTLTNDGAITNDGTITVN